MAERIKLDKNVFNKADFLKTVNTSFTQLGPTVVIEEPFGTVDEFFLEYERLFYEIPQLGELNSHEYLAKTSGEYINFQRTNEEIQALLDEIAQLRQELLDLNNEKFTLELELASKNSQNINSKKAPVRNTIKNLRDNAASTPGRQTTSQTLG